MRTNAFGDRYCATADEVRSAVESRAEDNPWLIYASMHEAPKAGEKATCEILTNRDGDLVCYVECDTVDAVEAIVAELKLEVL